MKYRFLSIIKDFVSLVLDYIFVFAVWVSLMWAFGARPKFILPVGMFLLPCILYFVRKYVRKLYVYLPLHLLTAVCAFLFFRTVAGADGKYVAELLVTVLVIIYFTVSSFLIRVRKSEPEKEPVSPVAVVIILAICIFALNYTGNTDIIRCVYICAIIFGVLYFAYIYLNRFIWFDFMNRKIITDMPTEKVLKAGVPYIAGFSIFYVFAAILWMNEGLLGRISDMLKRLGSCIVRFLFSLFTTKETGIIYAEPVPENLEVPVFQEMPEAGVRPFIVELIQKILVYLAVILAVSALIVLLVAIITGLVRHFRGVDDRISTELTTGYVEEHEKIERRQLSAKRERKLFLSPAERIRKLYVIIAGRNPFGDIGLKRLTVREFAEYYPDDKKDAALEFAGIYEKARYSPHNCTGEDFHRAKMLVGLLVQR